MKNKLMIASSLLICLALALWAENCTPTDLGNVCCRDGMHAEPVARWTCAWTPGGEFVCYQMYECMDDPIVQ